MGEAKPAKQLTHRTGEAQRNPSPADACPAALID